MRRTLIRLSPSTHVISLPSRWVKAHGLKKGAELSVEEREGDLIVSARARPHGGAATLDVSALPTRLVWVRLAAAYMAGYDSITVTTKDARQTAYLGRMAKYFPGLIIDEERTSQVHFKAIAAEEGVDIARLLNRLFQMTAVLIEDAIAAVRARDWPMLAAIKERDYLINSHAEYCLRHLNLRGYSPAAKTGAMHSYIKTLEMFADKSCALFAGIGTHRIILRDTAPLGSLLELYRRVQQLHAGYSQELLVQLEHAREKLLAALPRTHEHVRLSLTELYKLVFELEELETLLHA
jgi:phosphate uptake regulator